MARGRKKKYNREDVLVKAMDVFWKKGYEGTHLQELVAETGLNRFSLYNEFNGKEGLFFETLKLYLVHAKQIYRENLLCEEPAISNIYNHFNNIVLEDNYHGCMLVNTINNQHSVPKSSFDIATNFTDWIKECYVKNLQAGIKKTNAQIDDQLFELADAIITFDFGLSITGIILNNSQIKNSSNLFLDALLQPFFETLE